MPFGWGESQDAYNQAYTDNQPNEASFGHELIGGAAAFAGMKMFEDHQRKEGKTVNHQFAKELAVGFAGAEVDRLAETKGMDAYDRERAKHAAKEHAENMYDQHYQQQGDQFDPNNYQQPQQMQDQWGNY